MLRSTAPRMIRTKSLTMLDRVYEHVTVPPAVAQAIDTPWFQRLRGLKQLGVCHMLYPGAVHTRFEHSIGVSHLANLFAEALRTRQPELRLGEDDVTLVSLAGLCHDLGHGPFSHLFEDVIMKRFDNAKPFHHEDMSVRITQQMLSDLRFADSEINVVTSLIKGTYPANRVSQTTKSFLKEIVANERSGIDVDKCDYFLRDAICCFGKSVADVRAHRLFNSAKALPYGDDMVIAFEDKMAIALREYCFVRAKLHKSVYQHPVMKKLGHMTSDALFAAGPHFLIGGKTMEQCTHNIEDYLGLGDWIIEGILASRETQLEPARKILRRMQERDLYSLTMCCTLNPDRKVPVEVVKEELIEDMVSKGGVARADAEETLIVDSFGVHHGKGKRDPLTTVPFFNPKTPNPQVRTLFTDIKDAFTPHAFVERTMMTLVRDKKFSKAAREAGDRWVKKGEGNGDVIPHLVVFNDPSKL